MAAVERAQRIVSRIIPGNWGKVESGWLAQPLLSRIARCVWRRQDSPVPLAMFAHRQYTRKRNCAMRSDKKPLRIQSSSPGWFRARANRSYPEGKWLLLCISTGARLWRFPRGDRPKERRRKARQSEHAHREGHTVQARPVTPSGTPAMVKTLPLACGRNATCELRGETRGTGPTRC
jgi:hypothetical protein